MRDIMAEPAGVVAAGLAPRAGTLGEANILGPRTLGALADVEGDVLSFAK